MRIVRVVIASLLVFGLGATVAPAAVAQDTPDYVGSNPPGGGTTVSGSSESRGTTTGTLPITGADIAILLAIAVSLIVVGAVWMRAVRQRREVPLRA